MRTRSPSAAARASVSASTERGAHRVIEHARRRAAQRDPSIAAVAVGTHREVGVAERREPVRDRRARQRGIVAAAQENPREARGRRARDGALHALREIRAALRHGVEARVARGELADRVGRMHREPGRRPGGRSGRRRRREYVVEHRRVERGRLLGRERRTHARLHRAGRGALSEHHDDAVAFTAADARTAARRSARARPPTSTSLPGSAWARRT